MTTTFSTPPRAYRQTAVLTASPAQLVVMLYDGAHRFLHQAAVAMDERQAETTHNKLRRAEDIIEHLRQTLDHDQGELSARLEAIYAFCLRHLNQARTTRDSGKVREVSELLRELRESWAILARS